MAFKLRLFGKLYITIAVSSIGLILFVMMLSDYSEKQFSTIAPEHQAQLLKYGTQAAALVRENKIQKIDSWRKQVAAKENTWLAIMKSDVSWLSGGYDDDIFEGEAELTIGRDMRYPIHLYYAHNPIMKVILEDTGYNLLIQLPQRMRPGTYWNALHTLITLGLPTLLVAVLCVVIYRHIIAPLNQLQEATQNFSNGDYNARVGATLKHRNDEISELASSFDEMADRIGHLVTTQRQLIQDISHELRTPITRIKLVLEQPEKLEAISRIAHEIEGMQSLIEDTLMLSWLDNEKPVLNQEIVELALLLETIVEDAKFEFPSHNIILNVPENIIARNSNLRALGQALENIIRNALKYSPDKSLVSIQVQNPDTRILIYVEDEGPGVLEKHLDSIFKPFYRVDPARGGKNGGFGLGLALTKRQIEAIGGTITAKNRQPHGLTMTITLPN